MCKTSPAAPSKQVSKGFRSFILPRFKRRPDRLITQNTQQPSTGSPGVLRRHIFWIFRLFRDEKYFPLRGVRTKSLRPYASSAESGSRAFCRSRKTYRTKSSENSLALNPDDGIRQLFGQTTPARKRLTPAWRACASIWPSQRGCRSRSCLRDRLAGIEPGAASRNGWSSSSASPRGPWSASTMASRSRYATSRSIGSNSTGWPSCMIFSTVGRRTATTPTSTSSATRRLRSKRQFLQSIARKHLAPKRRSGFSLL